MPNAPPAPSMPVSVPIPPPPGQPSVVSGGGIPPPPPLPTTAIHLPGDPTYSGTSSAPEAP